MGCHKGWSLDFINQNFTKTFINSTLKAHRETVLVDRELSMLPATQTLVENTIRVNNIKQEIADLVTIRNELRLQLQNTEVSIRYKQLDMRDIINTDASKLEKRVFVRHCPHNDCRGFLSTQYKCGICENFTCQQCHEVIGISKDCVHVCNPDVVATVAMLKVDTKGCPKCAASIHKIDGCNQMFCINCQCSFNWITLRIETGPIHNPEYFRYLREHGHAIPRAADDGPCDEGLPQVATLRRFYNSKKLEMKSIGGVDVYEYVRWITHIFHVERPRFQTNAINDNVDLRIKYMMNQIDKKKFKQTLQQREKASLKKQDIEQVLSMIYAVSSTILRNSMACETAKEISECIKELIPLPAYAQASLAKISEKYNCVVPELKYEF
jgi:hypothetical protein